MAFQTLKLSDELLAKLGATPADFADKLTALLATSEADKAALSAAAKNQTETVTANAELLARLSTIEANVAALQKAPAFDRAALLAEAEAKASATASAILAKSGGAPLTAPTVAANDPAANGTAAADADPAKRYAADAKLQSEFPSAESYAAYCKLDAAGRVRISSNRK